MGSGAIGSADDSES